MDVEEAYQFFMSHGIDAKQASPELLAAAYKTLAKKFHPDKGGSPADMKRLNCAYDMISRLGEGAEHIYDATIKRDQTSSGRGYANRNSSQDKGHGRSANDFQRSSQEPSDLGGRENLGRRQPGRSFGERFVNKVTGMTVTFAITLLAVAGGRLIGGNLGRHDAEVLLARRHDSERKVELGAATSPTEDVRQYQDPPQTIPSYASGIAQAPPIATAPVSENLDARTYCNPKTSGVQVYNTPNNTDINPEWAPPAELGTGWTVSALNFVQSDYGNFLFGDLITPRGGMNLKGIYVKYEDWSCVEHYEANVKVVKTTSDFGVEGKNQAPVLPETNVRDFRISSISDRLRTYQKKYEISELSSKTVMPDFKGAQKEYRSYRSRIGAGFKEGVNFSGSMTIITIGCGAGCRWAVVGNLKTGEVSSFPLGGEAAMYLDLKFNQLSSVVGASYEGDDRQCYMDIFNWNGSKFVNIEHNRVDRISEASCFYDGARDKSWLD